MDLFILWLARSCSWLILLFTVFGAFYLLTNALALTQTSAWDTWRRRGRLSNRIVVAGAGRSMVPLSILLVFCFLGIGFLYGVCGSLAGEKFNQSHASNVNFFYQAIVPKDDTDE